MTTPTKVLCSTLLILTALIPAAHAYEPSWDGNHPDAASEAWTWMGHLTEVESSKTGSKLGRNGVGLIYYYTRNNTGSMGSMNFRSSSRTATLDGEGTSQATDTIYMAQYDDATFRARSGVLDLSFDAGPISDRVLSMPMTDNDTKQLNETLKLYPGLKVAPNFAPKKTRFEVVERDGSTLQLNMYSIWPVVSPPEGKIAFLGQAETYSFSDPMQVAVGTYKGKSVVGLTFVDRQWAQQYFGTYAMDGLNDLLKYANAMKYSHTWSAFHAVNERTKDWSFFHLWNQFKRTADARDVKVDYSGMVWVTNGGEAQFVKQDEYSWIGSGFVWNQGREVLMNYAADRYGFFPSKAHVTSPKLGIDVKMYATPALQNLNQPIPFYEAYGSGTGTWKGDPIRVQGRLESSRLMFRTQDYQEMMDVLKAEDDVPWRQVDLQKWLKAKMKDDLTRPLSDLEKKLRTMGALMSDIGLKISVFGDALSGNKDAVDNIDKTVMVYH